MLISPQRQPLPHRLNFDDMGAKMHNENQLIWKEIVYHGFAQLGNEHSPTPRRFEAYPIFSLDFVGAEIVSLFDVNLRFKLTLCSTSKFSRYRVLGKIQIEEPGVGRHPGR